MLVVVPASSQHLRARGARGHADGALLSLGSLVALGLQLGHMHADAEKALAAKCRRQLLDDAVVFPAALGRGGAAAGEDALVACALLLKSARLHQQIRLRSAVFGVLAKKGLVAALDHIHLQRGVCMSMCYNEKCACLFPKKIHPPPQPLDR